MKVFFVAGYDGAVIAATREQAQDWINKQRHSHNDLEIEERYLPFEIDRD